MINQHKVNFSISLPCRNAWGPRAAPHKVLGNISLQALETTLFHMMALRNIGTEVVIVYKYNLKQFK